MDLSVQTFLQYKENNPKQSAIEINNVIHIFPPHSPKPYKIKKYED
jgi:hypothetical protein